MLNSMQEAVVAITRRAPFAGQRRHAAHRRNQLHPGRPLVTPSAIPTCWPPCVPPSTTTRSATARQLSRPGRTFEINAALCIRRRAGRAARRNPHRSAEKSARLHRQCQHELRTPLTSSRATWKRCSRTPFRRRDNCGVSWNHPKKRHPHEPPHRGSARLASVEGPIQAFTAAARASSLVQDAIEVSEASLSIPS